MIYAANYLQINLIDILEETTENYIPNWKKTYHLKLCITKHDKN